MLLDKLYSYFISDYEKSDAYIVYRYKLLLHASFFTSLFSLTYLIVSLLIGFKPGVYLMTFNVIGFLVLPFLMKTPLPIKAVGNLYVFIGTLGVLLVIFYSGGIDSPVLPWLIASPILALLIVSRLYALVWTCISLASLAMLFLYSVNEKSYPAQYNNDWKTFFMFLSSSGVILIATTISLIFEQTTSRALKALEVQKEELEQSKEELAIKHLENLDKNEMLAAQREELITTSEQLKILNDKKDYLLEILAHDLKSPLATTQVMINLIKKDSFEPNSIEVKVIDMIVESSKKSLALIQKILNSENLENILYNIKLEPINLVEVIKKQTDTIRDHAGLKNIEMHINMADDVQYDVLVDKIYVLQIFENLLTNAVKFSPQHKRITISIKKVDHVIRTEIQDEGPGITADEMPMLFLKHKKLSNKPTGGESSNGLGLSIVKHYTELLKGKVWCESTPGKGSNFVVELPIFQA